LVLLQLPGLAARTVTKATGTKPPKEAEAFAINAEVTGAVAQAKGTKSRHAFGVRLTALLMAVHHPG